MRSFKRYVATSILGLGFLALTMATAEARTADACQTAWAKAVRSYLTQNRKAGPDGTQPKTVDDEELIAQAWEKAFEGACKLEQDGLKPEARVEAATLGVQILAKLDTRGCGRFLQFYMESTKPKDVCDMVSTGAGTAEIRQAIEASIPAK